MALSPKDASSFTTSRDEIHRLSLESLGSELNRRDDNDATSDISDEGNRAKISSFISKLFKLVEGGAYPHLISWTSNGRTFSVRNDAEFADKVLPTLFRHKNFSSFVRQLNMYGFQKVNKSRHQKDNPVFEFANPMFMHGRPDLLVNLRRRNSTAPQQVLQLSSSMHSDHGRPSFDNHFVMSRVQEIEHNNYRLNQQLIEAKEMILTQREIIRLLYEASRDNNPSLPIFELLENHLRSKHRIIDNTPDIQVTPAAEDNSDNSPRNPRSFNSSNSSLSNIAAASNSVREKSHFQLPAQFQQMPVQQIPIQMQPIDAVLQQQPNERGSHIPSMIQIPNLNQQQVPKNQTEMYSNMEDLLFYPE